MFFPLDKKFNAFVKKIESMIPEDASVTTNKQMAARFSSRKKYYVLGNNGWGDFMMLDQKDKNTLPLTLQAKYSTLINENGIILSKRINPEKNL